MKTLLALTACLLIQSFLHAQEFKPYPQANISVLQWQKYIDEVREKHGATAQDLDDAKLVTFSDDASRTFYAFTKPGHPAHPAWIARKPEQRGQSIYVGQIGYFAGAEPPFAKLFREYVALNEKLGANVSRSQNTDDKNGTLSHTPATSNADKSWVPSTEQKQALEKAVERYFLLNDSQQIDALYDLFTPTVKRMMSPTEFSQMHTSSYANSGKLNARKLLRVTWYKDAPNFPGVIAAVDFNTDYENFALHCGYVAFIEHADGTFLVQRAESNKIDKSIAKNMSESQIRNARNEFRC